MTSSRIATASATAASRVARRGSGNRQPRIDHGQPGQPSVREHRLDRGVVATGDHRERPREDPRRVIGRRLVRLPCLVVPPPGEPLLRLPTGLRAPLHVPLADLRLLQRLPRQPGDREPALSHQQHTPALGVVTASPNSAGSAGPSYVAPNGNRAVKCEPSSARPDSAPSETAYVVGPCPASKFSTQRTQRAGGTATLGTQTTVAVPHSRNWRQKVTRTGLRTVYCRQLRPPGPTPAGRRPGTARTRSACRWRTRGRGWRAR